MSLLLRSHAGAQYSPILTTHFTAIRALVLGTPAITFTLTRGIEGPGLPLSGHPHPVPSPSSIFTLPEVFQSLPQSLRCWPIGTLLSQKDIRGIEPLARALPGNREVGQARRAPEAEI